MTTRKPMSIRAYARHRGVNHSAVRRAIQSGRLAACLAYPGGKPQIADPELADREWEASRRPRADDPPQPPSEDYQAARARRESALATLAEMERDERAGRLIDADRARAEVIDVFTQVRTKLLGIPHRLKQRRPELDAAAVREVDDLIREALEALADREEAARG